MASQGKRMVPEALIKKLQEFSNNGLAALTAGNITTLTTNQINDLKCGDIVLKEDSTGKHAYIVSYKKDGTGICLTYADASVVETVSYDYSGSAWVYNSTDITPIKNVVANPTLAGTEANLTGLQVGDTKYKVPNGGSSNHLYMITFKCYEESISIISKVSCGFQNKSLNSDYETITLTQEEQNALINTIKGCIYNKFISKDNEESYESFVLINCDNGNGGNDGNTLGAMLNAYGNTDYNLIFNYIYGNNYDYSFQLSISDNELIFSGAENYNDINIKISETQLF